MSRRRYGASLAVLIALAGCSRHSSRKQEKSHSPVQVAAKVSPAPGNPMAGTAEQAPDSAGTIPAELRPSPFEQPQVPAANIAPSATPQPPKRPAPSKHVVKPFAPPAPLAVNSRTRSTSPALPSAPSITPATPAVGQFPKLPERTCCSATATYEPVKRNGLNRLIHGMPGFRRSDSSGGKGFVPPHALRDIQINVPPDASAPLVRKMRMDVKATVDESGRVTRIELLSPKDEGLATLAGYGANQWKFAPAKLNDQPVASEIILHFRFDNQSLAQAAR
jgi:hypothetical protein